MPPSSLDRRIVGHAQKCRQHFLIHFLRERLPFVFIALAVTLQPVPQYFVEKYRRGAAAQQRRSVVRFRYRSFAQTLAGRPPSCRSWRSAHFRRAAPRLTGLETSPRAAIPCRRRRACCASITRRVEALGVAIIAPSLDTNRELEFCTCSVTEAKYTSEYLRKVPDKRRISPSHAARSNPGTISASPVCVCGVSLEKSGDLSSSSARTAVLVFTLRYAGAARLYSRSVSSHSTRATASGSSSSGKRAGGHAAGAALTVGVIQRGGPTRMVTSAWRRRRPASVSKLP